jgi:hypothetical protein
VLATSLVLTLRAHRARFANVLLVAPAPFSAKVPARSSVGARA